MTASAAARWSCCAVAAVLAACSAGHAAAAPRSPENQVFQWVVTATNEDWPEESRNTSTAYLWLPDSCAKLRGLLILGANVPEHMLVGHSSIREACAKNDLGIVWAVPTFWNFRKETKGQDETQVAFLERLLQQLADVSGYPEVATAPWLPIGESRHLLMVCGLLNQRPDRCIAGICVKNPHEPQNKTVPLLWTLGTAQEWGQMKKDIRESWLDAGAYPNWMKQRLENSWPLSLIVEFGTGHFYCSDAMVEYFASYIDAAAKARLSDDSSPQLKAVDMDAGVLAHLPLPGQTDLAVIPYATATPEQRQRPWFFNEALAVRAQELTKADLTAAPQLVGVEAGEGCRTEPYALNSVTKLFVKSDGTFTVRPVLLDGIPEGFLAAGEPLAKAEGEPLAELDGLLTPNALGERPFAGDGLDPAYPNEPYWAHVDRVVERANTLGLIVALLPSWGDKWYRHAWGAGPEIFTAANARAYATWLGRRYREAGIIWVTGGDRPLRHDADLALMRAFAEGLREGDGGRHLITFHPPGGTSSSRYVHAEPWLDFHLLQTGHDRERASWAMVEHDWQMLPVRPVVNGEPAYEAHPNAFKGGDAGWLDQTDVRREFWWTVCDGAAGFAYGCHAIWQLWQPGREPINGPRAPWRESLDLPGAREVGLGARLLEALPGRRRPASHRLIDPPGAGIARPRACEAEDGGWLLAYLPEGQRVRVELGGLANAHARLTWFDPRNGERLPGEALARTARETSVLPPYSPAGRDWVLFLSAEQHPVPTLLGDLSKP